MPAWVAPVVVGAVGAAAQLGGAMAGSRAASNTADQQMKYAMQSGVGQNLLNSQSQLPWTSMGSQAMMQAGLMSGLSLPQKQTAQQIAAQLGINLPPGMPIDQALAWAAAQAGAVDAPHNKQKFQDFAQALQTAQQQNAYIDQVTASGGGAQPAPGFERYADFSYGGQIPGAPTLGDFSYGGAQPEFGYGGAIPEYERFTAAQMEADPGYAFRKAEGERALRSNLATAGLLGSGKAMRDMTRFGQGLASQEYQNAFNRALTEYQTQRGAEEEAYRRARGEYDIADAAEQEAYQRAGGEHALAQQTALTNYGLQRQQESDTYGRALGDWQTGYQKSMADQGAEYGRWADNWNRLATLAGAGQSSAQNVAGLNAAANAQSNLGVQAAQQQQGNAQQAGWQSVANFGGDLAQLGGWLYGRQQTPTTTPGTPPAPAGQPRNYAAWDEGYAQ